MTPPISFVFFRVVLAILVPLTCHINFRIGLSISTQKKSCWSFIGIELNLYVSLGRIDILLMLGLPFREHNTYLFIYIFDFSSAFCIFSIQTLRVLLDLYLSMPCYISCKCCLVLPYYYIEMIDF